KVGLARAVAAAGDLPAAVAMAEAALGEDAKYVEGWMLLGQLHRLLGDLAAARADFDTALTPRPRGVNIRLGRSALLILLREAEDAANRFLARVPNDEIGTALLATLLVRRNNLAKAIEVLKAAVEANPKSLRLLGFLSDAYLQANQPEAAASIIARSERLAPD